MKRCSEPGFSLLEVIVAVAITMVIMLVMFSGLNQVQRRYRGEQMITEVSDGTRSAAELLAQEISLAGHHGFETRRVAVAVIGSLSPQAVTLDDAADIYVGQRLLVGVGASQEMVEVQSVSGSAVTGTFRRNHLASSPVNTVGPLGTGVLASSTATLLQMYGDLYDDGSMVYVEYRVRDGALWRSETPVGSTVQNAPVVVLDNVVANPGGTPVFQYTTETYIGTAYIRHVSVTLTSETSANDPEMGSPQTQTVSFSVLPRNVDAAYRLDALIGGGDYLQAQPPGLPIPVS